MKKILILILLFNYCFLFCQNEKIIDSLKASLQNSNDSTKINTFIELSRLIKNVNKDEAIKFSNYGLKLAIKNNSLIGKAGCYNIQSIILNSVGELDSALVLAEIALSNATMQKDNNLIAKINRTIGMIYSNKGLFSQSLTYFLKALKYFEENNKKSSAAACNISIATNYYYQGNLIKSLEYHNKSLLLYKELKEDNNSIIEMNNIAGILYLQKKYEEALRTAKFALKKSESIMNKKEISNSLIIIANIYSDLGNNVQAKPFYERAIKIQNEIGDLQGLLVSIFNIADIFQSENNFQKAIQYKLDGLKIADELNDKYRKKECAKGLSQIYFVLKDYKNAYIYQTLYSDLNDTLLNEKSLELINDMQAKYDTEKKDKDIIKKEAEIKIQKADSNQKLLQRNAFIVGFFLMIILAIISFRSFKQKQKANAIISQQKHLVEEKHKEITDSINYAERIQRSFLASKKLLDDNLNEYFVFFKPKDVVSGDFYWASKLHNGNFVLVTADSTGHGVPGAIMSLLNVTSLESAIKENITDPSEILNHTRKTIIERLKKDGSLEGGKDGMDCSCIVLNIEKTILTYSAANNPIWVLRTVTSVAEEGDVSRSVPVESSRYEQSSTRTDSYELIELSPDKMPVGKHDKDHISFTQNRFNLQKGDVIYTLTDGMPDQFGGPKGKKFMYKKLKELLISISHLPISDQHLILKESLSYWKGDLEQVDDVCVIGIRI